MSVKDKLYIGANRFYHGAFALFKALLHWRHPRLTTGAGCLARIPDLLKEARVRHPMLVTDPFLREALAPRLEAILQEAGIEYTLFCDVKPNPIAADCERARDIYKKEGCDCFIGLGGGAPMDTAKATACLVVRPRMKLQWMKGILRVMHPLPPIIAIPTTAGTGSETTLAAVIVDQDTHHKMAIMDPVIMPRYAVLDPELTVGLPPSVTASTGMDALVHALEAYFSRSNNTKETKKLAEDAVCLIFQYLERAYGDGSDIEAREQMQIAAHKAGFAFSRVGVGNVHAIAHTLGGLYNTPHGLANAVILPYVMRDYGPIVYKRLARLAELTGLKTDGTEEEKALAFIEEVEAMNERMGIPKGFDFIRDEDIDQMITWALHEANPVYPVPWVYTREHFRKIIDQIRL